jgi:hypothetical protein
MPTSGGFSGSTLFVESVVAVNTTTVKIEFSQDPLAVSASGANDALNPANYALSGPGAITISVSTAVSGDPQSFYLTTSSPLLNGTWTLTAANIKTAAANPLVDPKSKTFVTTSLLSQPSVSNGALNASAEDTLRKHLNPALKGKNWNAIIAALATGDAYLLQLAQDLFKQLFKSTASGKYLDRKASEEGLTRNSLSDDLFKKLLIKTGSDKVTAKALAQVLEIYYGSDTVRANIDSIDGPFSIQTGDTLVVEIDDKTVIVQFESDDFQTAGSATAQEVAAVINKAFDDVGLSAFALPKDNNTTNKTFVRIYSGALGYRGYVRVWGGKAQNVLQFDDSIATTQAATTVWQIQNATAGGSPVTGNRVRFTWTGAGTDPSLILVRADDYITVYGSPFSASNRGSFKIVATGATYFEIESTVSANETVTQLAANDILFFRSVRKTLNTNDRAAFVIQTKPTESEVYLPATTQSIEMHPKSAAYLNYATPISTFRNKLVCTTLTRAANVVTVDTTVAHNLVAADTFYLAPGSPNIGQDFIPGVKTVVAPVTATTFTYAETGANVVASGTHYIYYCYRDGNGTVTMQSSAVHGLTSNQWVFLDNLMADAKVSPGPYFVSGDPSSTLQAGLVNYNHAAVKLSDGRVLMCGGQSLIGVVTDKTSIFDPTTLLWTTVASMNTARALHTLTLLSNGRVLCVGGFNGGSLKLCEIYDPTLDVWVPILDTTYTHSEHSAILLDDGRVLVGGGGNQHTELFDVATETWAIGPDLLNAGTTHGPMTKLRDGRIFIGGNQANANAEIFHPVMGFWQKTSSMATCVSRSHHGQHLVENGTSGLVYVLGGIDFVAGFITLNTIETYDPNTDTWTAKTAVTSSRESLTSVALTNGKIICVGGGPGSTTSDVYDILTDTTVSGPAVTSRSYSRGLLLDDKRALFTTDLFPTAYPVVFYPDIAIKKAGGVNGAFKITSINTKKFTVSTAASSKFAQETPFITSFSDKSGNTLTTKAYPFKAPIDLNHNGPYLIDRYGNISVTGTTALTTTSALTKGTSYSILNVSSTADFPTSGYLVFQFGKSNQVYPVKYLYKISSTQLALENSFIFTQDIPIGSTVTLVKQATSWVPENPEEIGAFYLTDSIIGRINASSVIKNIQGAGITVNQTVVYPGYIGLGNSQNLPSVGPKVNDIVYIYGNQDEVDALR